MKRKVNRLSRLIGVTSALSLTLALFLMPCVPSSAAAIRLERDPEPPPILPVDFSLTINQSGIAAQGAASVGSVESFDH